MRARAISERANAISERASAIPERGHTISERAGAISEPAGAILGRARAISERADAISKRASAISELASAIAERARVNFERARGHPRYVSCWEKNCLLAASGAVRDGDLPVHLDGGAVVTRVAVGVLLRDVAFDRARLKDAERGAAVGAAA